MRDLAAFRAPLASVCCTGRKITDMTSVPSSALLTCIPHPHMLFKVDISTFPGTPGRRVLHWAVDDWQKPDQAIWPAGTVSVDDKAVQTPVHEGARIQMTLPKV